MMNDWEKMASEQEARHLAGLDWARQVVADIAIYTSIFVIVREGTEYLYGQTTTGPDSRKRYYNTLLATRPVEAAV